MKRFVVSGLVAFLGCLVVGISLGTLPRRGIAGLAIPVVRADGGCSVASLKGPYAVARQGTLVTSVPALGLVAPAPWAEVALVNIDGAGSFSGKATVNIGGAVLSDVPFTGTYTVNSDCTGTNTVTAPSVGITIHQALVVIGGGQRFIETEADSLAVVEGRIEKLGD